MEIEINKKIWFSPWLKWIALMLAILVFFCAGIKCCSASQSNTPESNLWNEIEAGRRKHTAPQVLVERQDDVLKRMAVDGLLNVYLEDTTNVKSFYRRLASKYDEDSISVVYYAEEYQRIQLLFESHRLLFFQEHLKTDWPSVKYAIPEWIFKSSSKFNDPYFKDEDLCWFYEEIGLADAWKLSLGSSDVRIAVIDDGFDLTHPELKNKAIKTWNIPEYSDSIYSIESTISHGTHVASTALGAVGNYVGLGGVAPNASLIAIQLQSEEAYITLSALVDGIFYAIKNDADIINLSIESELGQLAETPLTYKDQLLLMNNYLKDEAVMWDEIFKIASEENVYVVQAAGNSGLLAGVDPMKRSDHSIVVGSISKEFKISTFSNFGQCVDIFAPGEGIFSAMPGGDIGPMDGTSMSSPIVAGSIALALSINQNLRLSDLKEKMIASGLPIIGGSRVIQIDKFLGLL